MKKLILIIIWMFFMVGFVTGQITITRSKNAPESTSHKASQHFDFSKMNGLKVVSLDEGFKTRKYMEERYKNYTPCIIPEYFLLGTLNKDFLRFDNNDKTRLAHELKKDEFDFYKNEEVQKALFISYYILDTLGFEVSLKRWTNGSLMIYSEKLNDKINAYFDGPANLRHDLFNSDEEFYSYLLGCYFRYGTMEDNHVYSLRTSFINSDRMFQLLRKVGSKKITYTLFNNISGGVEFTFEAPFLLEKYFDSLIKM